jgi:hypothetical protein
VTLDAQLVADVKAIAAAVKNTVPVTAVRAGEKQRWWLEPPKPAG